MKVHFIGIGGIGVSALAQYYLSKSWQVFGSDLCSTEITELLEAKGAKIFIGHKAENIASDLDLVIHSPAVGEDNPEIKQAREFGIRTSSYPEALGALSKDYFTIAVSGAHGKSTTAAMLSLILLKNGLNPTAILGAKLKEFGDSNFRAGDSKYLVIEADEYKGSFLNYYPNIIVLTNIEEEHLDYFGRLENILEAFRDYICHLPTDGVLVYNKDDKNIAKLDFGNESFKKVSFSRDDKEIEKIRKILQVPGLHNALNGLAAFRAARALGLGEKEIFSAVSEYRGAWRRFETRAAELAGKKIIIVSDYAHHPTEIDATLKAAREKWPKKKIWAIFQPHQKQRTHFLFDKLVDCFTRAPVDKIVLLPIYDVAGREKEGIEKEVSSEKLCQAISGKGKPALYLDSFEKAKEFLADSAEEGDVLLIMGAGDIYDLDKMLST